MWLLEPSHRPAFGSIAVVLQALATGVMIPLTKQPPVTLRDSVITSGRQSEGYLPLGGDEEASPVINACSANASYEVRAGSPDESISGYLRQSFKAKRKATMQYKPTTQIEPIQEFACRHRPTARRMTTDLEEGLRDAVKMLKDKHAEDAEALTMWRPPTNQNSYWKPSAPHKETFQRPNLAASGNSQPGPTTIVASSGAQDSSNMVGNLDSFAVNVDVLLDNHNVNSTCAGAGATGYEYQSILQLMKEASALTEESLDAEKEDKGSDYMNASDSVAAELYNHTPGGPDSASLGPRLLRRRNSREL